MPVGYLDPPSELRELATFLTASGLVELGHESAGIAAHCWAYEGLGDMGIFGGVHYSAMVNRVCEAIQNGELDLEIFPRSIKHAFKRGRFVLRFHRVKPVTLVPYNAHTAKDAAREVTDLGPRLFADEPTMGRDLIVGLVSSPERGLERIILGELVKVAGRDAWGYQYEPVEIYSALGGAYGDGAAMPPPEDVPAPDVTRGLPPARENNA